MGFLEAFFKKQGDELTKDDIETFISRQIEENLNLDYKNIRILSNFDKLSEHISAFANSDGGLLILGISEEEKGKGENLKIFPKETTWGSEYSTKEQLENKIISKIRPRINRLKIYHVRKGNGSEEVIFLIDIPQSDNPPHMACDNRYYKRLNFRKVPMEHYEVSDFFGRRRKPLISLHLELIELQRTKDLECVFKINLCLQNIGKDIAKYVRMVAGFSNVEIQNIKKGLKIRRIDFLRRGKPTIQYDSEGSIFYPTNMRIFIGEVSLKYINVNDKAIVNYEIYAENMNVVIGEIIFSIPQLETLYVLIEKNIPAIITSEKI